MISLSALLAFFVCFSAFSHPRGLFPQPSSLQLPAGTFAKPCTCLGKGRGDRHRALTWLVAPVHWSLCWVHAHSSKPSAVMFEKWAQNLQCYRAVVCRSIAPLPSPSPPLLLSLQASDRKDKELKLSGWEKSALLLASVCAWSLREEFHTRVKWTLSAKLVCPAPSLWGKSKCKGTTFLLPHPTSSSPSIPLGLKNKECTRSCSRSQTGEGDSGAVWKLPTAHDSVSLSTPKTENLGKNHNCYLAQFPRRGKETAETRMFTENIWIIINGRNN